MKQRDVIDNLIRGKKADRVGLYDSPWTETIQKWRDENNLKNS